MTSKGAFLKLKGIVLNALLKYSQPDMLIVDINLTVCIIIPSDGDEMLLPRVNKIFVLL